MADSKQAHLNGAYYGPSIPPPRNTYHRPGHRSSSICCCNPFTCLCQCFFNLICKLICTVLVLLAIVVVILWLLFRPNPLKFHITDANLTQFELTSNTLKYNLALNVSVRNPNSRIGIYYDPIQADAYYRSQRFSTVNLIPFYQGHKNTTDLQLTFTGQQVMTIDATEFASDKGKGVFDVELKLRMRVRFRLIKLLKIRVGKFRGKVDCGITAPVSGSEVKFVQKRCDIKYV